MKVSYRPSGVCSSLYEIDVNGHILNNITIQGGCNGNLKGISSLIKGMKIEDIIERLEGIKCGYKNTSCPDQIAKALKAYLESIK